ncbi:MAG: hypothetical protein IAE94_11775 [Chthoniobacterales bacterium]|nr:hypothetical protein [Chthoniobacterales bacterium]
MEPPPDKKKIGDQNAPEGGGDIPFPARRLPNAALCRVRKLSGEYYECMVPNPESCRYAMSFGDSYFCLSPLAHEKKSVENSADGEG